MQQDDHSMHEPATGMSFWRSPVGIALIVFLAIAAILLGYEHRIHIFGGAYGSVIFLFAWVGLHFLMHRGHGGHQGHGGHRHHSGRGTAAKPLAGTNADQDKRVGDK